MGLNIYFEKNMKKKSVYATILDAILEFSASHQLCQFMPAVSDLQTLPNILVDSISYSTGGSGFQIFGPDCHPPIIAF